MAPVPIEPEVRYTGAAVVALHVLSILYFSQRAVVSLRRSYKALSPSQDVRSRMDRRRKLVPIFSVLSAVALLTAVYTSVAYTSLSYGVWADERGIGSTEKPGGSKGLEDGTAADASVVHPGHGLRELFFDRVRWLADTPIYQDAFEIVSEKARRFWWGQQVDLSLVPWSMLLAVEGRRRGIPNLLAFLCLAHLVNMSFAQNLFYVALLLTPTPLPEENDEPGRLARLCNVAFPPKPRSWFLGPGFLLFSAIVSYGAVFLLPYAAETPSFNLVLRISRGLTFAPLVLHTIAPTSWGSVRRSHRKASPAIADLFRFMAVMAFLLHGAATVRGLRYNVPHAHYHRHSRLLPWDIEERSRWERTTTAVGKLLGATRDHPVVAAVGYDVMLSALSVGLWAAVRSLGAGDILTSVVPLHKKFGDAANSTDEADKDADSEQTTTNNDNDESESVPNTRRSTRQRKVAKDEENDREPPTPRRRGRPRKVKQDPEEVPGDETYEPTTEEKSSAQGDPLPSQEADLEAAGLAWGLISVGGLGLGSAGVFGGECLAR